MMPFHINSSSRGFVTLLISSLTLVGCGKSSQISDSLPRDDSSRHDTIQQLDTPFHADNDIAMVVGSMADALAVGEPLDPSAYNFTGVLTDGGGAPLYVDKARNPGEWTVRVESPSYAVISNTRDGDLVAADIVDYLTSCLKITAEPIQTSSSPRKGDYLVFALHKGYITFRAPAPDALQGCHITVSLTDSI